MRKKINYKVLLFCFIITTVVLFFTSKSSPFYPMNDWVDVNAFMTVGKSMMKGIVPYKDLFEQKGPVLYFIYGIASLISDTSYIGVFILEIISMTLTLYFCYLIAKLFLSEKKSILLLPVFLLLITTCAAFTHGGSCEEAMFLPQIITLYYFIRHFKNKEMNYKEYMLVGFFAGIILLIKYTSLGLWFAFQLIMIISYFKKKKSREAILSSIMFLSGMMIPIIITLIYFGINNGINEFIDVYFVTNMTVYTEKISILGRFIKLIETFFNTLFRNNLVVTSLVLFYPLLLWRLSLEKEYKWYLIIIYLFTIFGVFYGLKSYSYYVLPVNLFILFSLISLFTYIKDKKLNKNYKIIFTIVLVLTFSLSYLISNNRYFHGIKKEDLFQYKFAEEIKKEDNPTVVNIGYLDFGVYLTSGVYPTTYFFEQQNFKYDNFPDNVDAFMNYIRNKETMFIVYIKNYKNHDDPFLEEEKLRENYDIIIDEIPFDYEWHTYYAYLWKVKE